MFVRMGINTSLASAILFGKKMRRLNQISGTKISICFGACKMRHLNRALVLNENFLILGLQLQIARVNHSAVISMQKSFKPS